MAHQWSGWPGCYCKRCGVEHATENAIAEGWLDFEGEDIEHLQEKWKSPIHKELVELCDNNCEADMTEEEFKKITEKGIELEKQISQKESLS